MKQALVAALVVLAFSGKLSANLHRSCSDVVALTNDNFEIQVAKSRDQVWVVLFYSSGCIHSKKVAEEFCEAATALKGIAKLGAVQDDSRNGKLYDGHGITASKVVKEFSKTVISEGIAKMGVVDDDGETDRLYEAFEVKDHPTVLIFYGDERSEIPDPLTSEHLIRIVKEAVKYVNRRPITGPWDK